MRYTIQHHGVPVGTVDLAIAELSAGTMTAAPGYAAIRQTVRKGSQALLQLGFYGAASRDLEALDESVAASLQAAAALAFELVNAEGEQVPTTFVNLIEPEADSRVVVLARFSHIHAPVGARKIDPADAAGSASAPSDLRGV